MSEIKRTQRLKNKDYYLMIKQAVALAALTLSISANAAIVTHGSLSSDDTTNIIVDSLNNVEYLRLDVIAEYNLLQTIGVLDTQDGGGWSIATSIEAVQFTAALLGGTSRCTHDGDYVVMAHCGSFDGWADGDFGDSYTNADDLVWFLGGDGDSDYIVIDDASYGNDISIRDYTTYDADLQFAGYNRSLLVGYLLVRPSAVPIPAAAWLFGSALIGLAGIKRKK